MVLLKILLSFFMAILIIDSVQNRETNSSNILTNKTQTNEVQDHKSAIFEPFKEIEDKHLESQNLSKAVFKNETKCVEDTMHLTCSSGRRIVVDTITFGKSKTCTHHPWPTGCLRQNYHFHPCTGLQICSVKAPAYDIRRCGLSDYVHMEYRCIQASSLHDICGTGKTNTSLTDPSGFISTPGYPRQITTVLHDLHCSISISLSEGYKIKLFLVDSTIVTPSQNNVSKQCIFKIVMTELSNGVELKTTKLCLEKVYLRNEMIFTSDTNQLKIEVYADDTMLNNKRKKWLLLYYQGFNENSIGEPVHQETQLTHGKRTGNPGAQWTTTLQDYQFLYYKYSSGKLKEMEDPGNVNMTSNQVTEFEASTVENLVTNWHGLTLEMIVGFTFGGVVLVTLLLVLVVYLCKHYYSELCICTTSTVLHIRKVTLENDDLEEQQTENNSSPALIEPHQNSGYENQAFVASVMGGAQSNQDESTLTQPFSKECLGENMEIYLENDFSVCESPNMSGSHDHGNNGTFQKCGAEPSTHTGESDTKRTVNLKTNGEHVAVMQQENELVHNRVNDWVDSQVNCSNETLNVVHVEDEYGQVGRFLTVRDGVKVGKCSYETDIDEGVILDQEDIGVTVTGHDRLMAKSFAKKAILGPQVLPVNNMYDINKCQISNSDENTGSTYDPDTKLLHYVSIQHLQQNNNKSSNPDRQENKTVYTSIDFQKSKQLQQKVVESFLQSQYAKGSHDPVSSNEYEVPTSLAKTDSNYQGSPLHIVKPNSNGKIQSHMSPSGDSHNTKHMVLAPKCESKQQAHSNNINNDLNTRTGISEDCKYQNCGQVVQNVKPNQVDNRESKSKKRAAPLPPKQPPPEEEDTLSSGSPSLKDRPGVAPKPILKRAQNGHM